MLNKNTFEPTLNLLQVNKILFYLRKFEQTDKVERFYFVINVIRIQINQSYQSDGPNLFNYSFWSISI